MSARLNKQSRIADKLFYGVLVLLVIVLGGLGSVIIAQRLSDMERRIDHRVQTAVWFLEGTLPHEVTHLHAKGIREAIERTGSDELQAVEIFDRNEQRIYIYEREGRESVAYDTAVTRDLFFDHDRSGKFVAYFSKQSILSQIRWREFLRLLILISGAGLALGAGISYLVKRWVVDPIEKTRNFSAALAAGHYDQRIIVTTSDEMGMLQNSLNHMATNLQESVQQLIEASRLKSEFLANLSHEIRTPMNAVIGFADILLDDETNPERRESLETIKRSSNILLDIINHILDFSRIKSGEVKLDLSRFLVHEVIDEMTPLIRQKLHGRNIVFHVVIDDRIREPLNADRLRLRQVLLNLLVNATKFTEQGSITLSVIPDPERQGVRFSVTDTGVGIPPEHHERIFEAFTQVDATRTRQYGGAGLGLAISKQLVELMGGRIWVESVPKNGTTISFTVASV